MEERIEIVVKGINYITELENGLAAAEVRAEELNQTISGLGSAVGRSARQFRLLRQEARNRFLLGRSLEQPRVGGRFGPDPNRQQRFRAYREGRAATSAASEVRERARLLNIRAKESRLERDLTRLEAVNKRAEIEIQRKEKNALLKREEVIKRFQGRIAEFNRKGGGSLLGEDLQKEARAYQKSFEAAARSVVKGEREIGSNIRYIHRLSNAYEQLNRKQNEAIKTRDGASQQRRLADDLQARADELLRTSVISDKHYRNLGKRVKEILARANESDISGARRASSQLSWMIGRLEKQQRQVNKISREQVGSARSANSLGVLERRIIGVRDTLADKMPANNLLNQIKNLRTMLNDGKVNEFTLGITKLRGEVDSLTASERNFAKAKARSNAVSDLTSKINSGKRLTPAQARRYGELTGTADQKLLPPSIKFARGQEPPRTRMTGVSREMLVGPSGRRAVIGGDQGGMMSRLLQGDTFTAKQLAAQVKESQNAAAKARQDLARKGKTNLSWITALDAMDQLGAETAKRINERKPKIIDSVAKLGRSITGLLDSGRISESTANDLRQRLRGIGGATKSTTALPNSFTGAGNLFDEFESRLGRIQKAVSAFSQRAAKTVEKPRNVNIPGTNENLLAAAKARDSISKLRSSLDQVGEFTPGSGLSKRLTALQNQVSSLIDMVESGRKAQFDIDFSEASRKVREFKEELNGFRKEEERVAQQQKDRDKQFAKNSRGTANLQSLNRQKASMQLEDAKATKDIRALFDRLDMLAIGGIQGIDPAGFNQAKSAISSLVSVRDLGDLDTYKLGLVQSQNAVAKLENAIRKKNAQERADASATSKSRKELKAKETELSSLQRATDKYSESVDRLGNILKRSDIGAAAVNLLQQAQKKLDDVPSLLSGGNIGVAKSRTGSANSLMNRALSGMQADAKAGSTLKATAARADEARKKLEALRFQLSEVQSLQTQFNRTDFLTAGGLIDVGSLKKDIVGFGQKADDIIGLTKKATKQATDLANSMSLAADRAEEVGRNMKESNKQFKSDFSMRMRNQDAMDIVPAQANQLKTIDQTLLRIASQGINVDEERKQIKTRLAQLDSNSLGTAQQASNLLAKDIKSLRSIVALRNEELKTRKAIAGSGDLAEGFSAQAKRAKNLYNDFLVLGGSVQSASFPTARSKKDLERNDATRASLNNAVATSLSNLQSVLNAASVSQDQMTPDLLSQIQKALDPIAKDLTSTKKALKASTSGGAAAVPASAKKGISESVDLPNKINLALGATEELEKKLLGLQKKKVDVTQQLTSVQDLLTRSKQKDFQISSATLKLIDDTNKSTKQFVRTSKAGLAGNGGSEAATLSDMLKSFQNNKAIKATFLEGRSTEQAISDSIAAFRANQQKQGGFMSSLGSKIGPAAGSFGSAAQNAAESFASTLTANTPKAFSAATRFGESAISAFKKVFKIQSPSRVMIEIALNLIDAYISTLESAIPQVEAASKEAFAAKQLGAGASSGLKEHKLSSQSRELGYAESLRFFGVLSQAQMDNPTAAVDIVRARGAGVDIGALPEYDQARNDRFIGKQSPEVDRIQAVLRDFYGLQENGSFSVKNASQSAEAARDNAQELFAATSNFAAQLDGITSILKSAASLAGGLSEKVAAGTKSSGAAIQNQIAQEPVLFEQAAKTAAGIDAEYATKYQERQKIAEEFKAPIAEAKRLDDEAKKKEIADQFAAARAQADIDRQAAIDATSGSSASNSIDSTSSGEKKIRSAAQRFFDKISSAIDAAGGIFGGGIGSGGGKGLPPRPPSSSFPSGPGGGGTLGQQLQGADKQKLLQLTSVSTKELMRASLADVDAFGEALSAIRGTIDKTDKNFAKFDKQLRNTLNRIGDVKARRQPDADPLVRRAGTRGAQAISEGLVGGAFPLLFGQGIGASVLGGLGGAAGGFMGGALGFGLSLVGTALGTAFDQLVQSAIDTGSALKDVISNFDQIKQSSLISNKAVENLASSMIDSGMKASAYALIQADLSSKIGNEGVQKLKDASAASDRFARAMATLGVQLQVFVAGPLTAFLNGISSALETKGLASSATTLFKESSQQKQKEALRLLEQGASLETKNRVKANRDSIGSKFGFYSNDFETYLAGASATTLQRVVSALSAGNDKNRKLNPVEKANENVLAADQNVAIAQSRLGYAQKAGEAVSIVKEMQQQQIAFRREQEDLDRQAFQIRRDYEQQIFDIRKGVEDKIRDLAIQAKEKEIELLVKQGEIRQKHLGMAISQMQLNVVGDDLATSLVDSVGEYLSARMSAENQIQQERKRFELDMLNIDIESQRFKLETAKTVSRLNQATARQVEQINFNTIRRNEDYSRLDLKYQLRISRLRFYLIEKELEASAAQWKLKVAEINLAMSSGTIRPDASAAVMDYIRGINEALDYNDKVLKTTRDQREALADMQQTAEMEPRLQLISAPAMRSVDTSGVTRQYSNLKRLRKEMQDLMQEYNNLQKAEDQANFLRSVSSKTFDDYYESVKNYEEAIQGLSDSMLAEGAREAAIRSSYAKAIEQIRINPKIDPKNKAQITQYLKLFEEIRVLTDKSSRTIDIYTSRINENVSGIEENRNAINALLGPIKEYDKALELINQSGVADENKAYNDRLLAATAENDRLKEKLDLLNNIKEVVDSWTESVTSFSTELIKSGNVMESLKGFVENLADKAASLIVEFTIKPVQERMFKQVADFLGFRPEQNPLLSPLNTIAANTNSLITAVNNIGSAIKIPLVQQASPVPVAAPAAPVAPRPADRAALPSPAAPVVAAPVVPAPANGISPLMGLMPPSWMQTARTGLKPGFDISLPFDTKVLGREATKGMQAGYEDILLEFTDNGDKIRLLISGLRDVNAKVDSQISALSPIGRTGTEGVQYAYGSPNGIVSDKLVETLKQKILYAIPEPAVQTTTGVPSPDSRQIAQAIGADVGAAISVAQRVNPDDKILQAIAKYFPQNYMSNGSETCTASVLQSLERTGKNTGVNLKELLTPGLYTQPGANNPQQALVQMMDKYGWAPIPGLGTPTRLTDITGTSVMANRLTAQEYLDAVKNNLIPTGAVGYATTKSNPNSQDGASGNDLFVAMNGGREHYNSSRRPFTLPYGSDTQSIFMIVPKTAIQPEVPGLPQPAEAVQPQQTLQQMLGIPAGSPTSSAQNSIRRMARLVPADPITGPQAALETAGGSSSGATQIVDAIGRVQREIGGLPGAIASAMQGAARSASQAQAAPAAAAPTITPKQEAAQNQFSEKLKAFGEKIGAGMTILSGAAMGIGGIQLMKEGGIYNTLMGLSSIFGSVATIASGVSAMKTAFAAPAKSSATPQAPASTQKFADGGRPPLGRPSWIGEEGPELWWPDQSGTIIPLEDLYVPGLDGPAAFDSTGSGGMGAGVDSSAPGATGGAAPGSLAYARQKIAMARRAEAMQAARNALISSNQSSDSSDPFMENREALNTTATVSKEREAQRAIEQSMTSQQPMNIKYEAQVINNVEYVTSDQFQKGMSDAAERGRALTIGALKNSVKVRRQVGM